MANLYVQRATLTGLSPSYTAADPAGDEFANSGRAVLHVKNGGAASIDVTINSEAPCDYGYDHDVVVAVPAGAERIIGPFPKQRFNDPLSKVHVSYSAVTSVTVAVLEVP